MTPDFGRKTKSRDALLQLIRTEIAACRGTIPARVLAYDASEQRATVQPMIRVSYMDPDTLERVTQQADVVANVPVAFPSAEGAAVTFPLAVGSRATLWIAERALDEWLATGGADVSPADPRRFDATDGILYPGGRPFADPLGSSAYDASDVVVYSSTGVRLGDATATDFVALASLVSANFSALEAVFTAWVPSPGDGGTVLKTALTTLISGGWPSGVAATKVKAV